MSLLGVILLPVNVIGYLWAWRQWIRWMSGELNIGKRDFDGFIFVFAGGILGSLIAIPWPIYILIELGKRGNRRYKSHGPHESLLAALAMRLVETRPERKQRKMLAKS